MKRTFKEKVLDIIYNQAFWEEGQFHETGQTYHIYRMDMCEELGRAIEALKEDEDGGNFGSGQDAAVLYAGHHVDDGLVDQVACMNVGSFRGFEPFPYDMASLPDQVAARRMYYVCSYIDSAGNRRLSREIPLSPAVSGTLRKDSAGERVWNCAIYMDRAAFNPGDTVQFKGILYDAGGMNTAPEGKKVKVLLYGTQGERLDSSDAVTGPYGSFAGSFPLPAGGRNGRYVIAVEEQGRTISRKTLAVDDFVLPTYSLTFDDAEGFVFPGGKVEVSGHVESYTGHSISSATVRYIVEKDFDVLVAEGVAPLDADGRRAALRTDRFGQSADGLLLCFLTR